MIEMGRLVGWQPGEGNGTGREPGSGVPGGHDAPGVPGPQGGPTRDARLAGFARGGAWDDCRPGPELAAVLTAVAGPEWRCPGAEPDELIGVLRRAAALESWASAAKLAVIRELIRQDDLSFLARPRHGDLPDEWSDSLSHELALALAVSVQSAEKTTLTAWELGARLPGIAALHADGTLTYSKARLIAETFQWLSDEDAARAEAMILPQLAGTTGKTYGQVMNLAARIACEVDPGLAERRREAAVKHASRVQMYREQSGAAALSGRDLPPDETLAAYANVTARAAQYKDSGAFPGARMDQLRSTAYLDLINGRTADARIALGHLSTDTPDPEAAPGTGTAVTNPGDGDSDNGGESGGTEPPGGQGPGGSPGSSGMSGRGEPGDAVLDGNDLPGGGRGNGKPHVVNAPGGSVLDHTDPEETDLANGNAAPGGEQGRASDAEDGARNQSASAALRGQPGGRPVLADLVFPLATLLGLAERPGEGHGLGVLDPDLCRDLAELAAASPHSRVCVTVTDPDGIAIGHGCGRPGKLAGVASGQLRGGAPPPPAALPARVNLTITADRLSAMLPGASGSPGRPSQRAPTGWALTWRDTGGSGSPGDPDWCGTWALTLPGGLELAVRIEPVPTYGCDHRHESHGYEPNDTLRHLVQVRDYTCTFPPCSRHARESDFEHARPYDKGGRTCSCNAGARSRKCHRIKQSNSWNVTQSRPGWHEWTTPTGRTYIQAPYRYPV